jgi:hypothetical protein
MWIVARGELLESPDQLAPPVHRQRLAVQFEPVPPKPRPAGGNGETQERWIEARQDQP